MDGGGGQSQSNMAENAATVTATAAERVDGTPSPHHRSISAVDTNTSTLLYHTQTSSDSGNGNAFKTVDNGAAVITSAHNVTSTPQPLTASSTNLFVPSKDVFDATNNSSLVGLTRCASSVVSIGRLLTSELGLSSTEHAVHMADPLSVVTTIALQNSSLVDKYTPAGTAVTAEDTPAAVRSEIVLTASSPAVLPDVCNTSDKVPKKPCLRAASSSASASSGQASSSSQSSGSQPYHDASIDVRDTPGGSGISHASEVKFPQLRARYRSCRLPVICRYIAWSTVVCIVVGCSVLTVYFGFRYALFSLLTVNANNCINK